MGFSSMDDLINEITTNGKFERLSGSRVIVTGATSVAGRWHECLSGIGMGGSATLTGTAGVAFALDSTLSGCMQRANPSVSPDTAHVFTFRVSTPQSLVTPGEARLLDFLYVYPSLNITTPTTLNNAAAKPTRLGTGAGVKVIAVVTSALGAANTAITVSYTNQAGVAGRTGTINCSANSLPVGSLLTSAAAGQLGGPYMNMQAGDTGVRSIESYSVASGTTGAVALILVREEASVPIIAANAPLAQDYAFNTPQFPKIDDLAFLGIVVNIGGALTTNQALNYEVAVGWG